MMTWSASARIAAAALMTTLAVLSIGWLARAPYDPPASSGALLRLSWRFRPEPSATCRPRSQAELDALPVHMRTPEVCESEPVVYHAIRRIEDGPADTIRVLRGGIKQDRPVYVLLDTALVPGSYRVRVHLVRERTGAAQEPVLAPLDTVLQIGPGAIGLVTIDGAGGRFVAVTPAAR